MSVVTPAVYQAFAKRGFGPRLTPPVERVRLSWRFQIARALLRDSFAAALAPEPVHRLATDGGTGVPLFRADELHVFLSQTETGPPEQPREGRWWEFWPTSDGSYAMFPGDATWPPSVVTTLWIPANRSAHVRRLDLGFLLPRGHPMSSVGPVVPPEPCELLAEAEPGAPYVGRCKNAGCGGECSPHVVVHPDDGIYRLLGCNC